MQKSDHETQEPGMGLTDLLFILFKHKGKILLCAFAGLAAAGAYYFLAPPPYQSQAKLLVRYVLDRNAVDSLDSQVKTPGAASYNDNLLASEIEILTSWDLAEQVATSVTPGRLVPGAMGTAGVAAAARSILLGLDVTASKGSNVLLISYKNSDPELAVTVLQDLVNRYFVKHLEVHRSASAFDYVSKETAQVRERLDRIDAQLKSLKDRAGIISLADSMASLAAEMTKGEDALHAAEAEEAEQRARVRAMEGWLAAPGASREEPALPRPDPQVAQNYQALVSQGLRLAQTKQDLLARFMPESRTVQLCQAQIDSLESQRSDLEKKFPGLAAMATSAVTSQGSQPSLNSEKARLAAIQAKTEALKSQLDDFKKQAALLAEIGPQIAQLEQKKEVEEADYKYFQGSLEKARVDEALDPSKMPNISVVQKPSPAMRSISDRKKILTGLAAGGGVLGLALALLLELGVDRTVRRPLELDGMRIPRMLSIPDLARNGHARLRSPQRNGEASAALVTTASRKNAPWDEGHFIRPFCESLRDRLILYFHLNNMTRKPKLVAVTGCSVGAGASTLAGGLASALSETGDGKVLLVDMNAGHEEIHPFFGGKHAASLAEAIESGNRLTATSENLYLARAGSESAGPMQLIPKKFYDLVPRLKASEFDYIIFDMPPLGQTSATLAMAGFMDKVLLVVEAEVSSREAVKRDFKELTAARANVSAVFNKSRTYGPKWLRDEA